jgi:hypothetical protein
MSLTREERKLLHQKSRQPTFGANKPDNTEGFEGDISFRQVQGSGTVQYLKEDGNWKPISSSGDMPPVRIGQGGGRSVTSTSGGVADHGDLTSLIGYDHHTQYLLIDGTRAMTSVVTIGADSDGTDRSITWGHSTLKTIMGIDDSSDAFVINTDAAFDATLANNSFSIDANHNVIIAGDVSVGDDLFLTSSGSIINWNSGDVTLTHATGKLTFGGDGTVELDFNNHEMTNVDINSGTIDATTIGVSTHTTIKGTTIDATTDFTIDGLVITADTITNDATLTVDSAGDIILDANSGVTKFYLAGDTDDLCTLTVAANGATTIATADSDGAVGHLILDADGDITLDPAGGDVYVKTASSVDPSIQFNSNSTDYWRMGVDTSDSNKFKIHGPTVTALVNNSYFELGATEDAGQGITLTGDGLQFNTDVEYLYATGGRMTIGNVALGLRVGPPVAFTSATGLAHGDEQLTYDSFGIRWKTLSGGDYNGQHIAGGEADYANNYAMVGTSFVSTQYANHATDFVLTGG